MLHAQCKGLLFLTLPFQWVEFQWGGCTRSGEGTQPGRWLELSRDIPYHIVQLSAIERESRMGVRVRNQHSFCTGTGWTGGSNYLYITCVVFYLFLLLHLINNFNFKPPDFLVFTFPFLLPCPTECGGGEWESFSVVLICLLMLTHSSNILWSMDQL